MKRKWSSGKVKEVQRWLIKRWPESFTQGPDLRPLSLQIHKELLKFREENPQLSSRVLHEVLKRHTTSYGYLYGMIKHKKRYDLDNQAVGEVSVEHRDWAKATLRKKQKLAQKLRKQAKRELQSQRRKPVAGKQQEKVVFKSATASGTASPVIKYKQARRKLHKSTSADPVDLAS